MFQHLLEDIALGLEERSIPYMVIGEPTSNTFVVG
jgi:hypothetical protein